MFIFLLKGLVLGASAGFSPGPLTMLVVSETLNHNCRAGMRIAAAPLITDTPIVLLSYLVLSKLTGLELILGILAIAGSVYISMLGVENFRAKPVDTSKAVENPRSLRKGVLVNFLSPHPYIFWIAVGAPIMINAVKLSVVHLIAFIFGFYLCLVGSKVLIAVVVGKSKRFVEGRAYIWVNRVLGVLLILLALLLFREGLGHLLPYFI